MSHPIRLLHLEDDPRDAELLRLRLEGAGLSCDIRWVDGKEAFESALGRETFDLVLSDYNLPGYNGLAALSYVREKQPELPVIMISGGLSEEEAVDCLKAGATDYVLKQRPQRLDTAVRRALIEKEERAALRRAEDAIRALNADLEARVRLRTAELETANRFLDSVIENIPHMVFVKDAVDLRLVRVNRAVEELLGCPQDELLGKTAHDICSKEEADFFVSKDRQVLAGGEAQDIVEESIRTFKGERLLHTKKIPIFDESGRPRYLLGISEDVTEQKKRERDIQRLNAALEQRSAEVEAANRAKSAFLATMSHEIRTPMNGMLGMLELLSLSGLTIEQRATLDTARESSKSLLRIIDDILDISMIEAGKLKVRPEVVSVRQVIDAVHNIFAGNAGSKGLLLRRAVDPRISPALLADPGRLGQILNNFVSNSIKFTPKGSIEISAELIDRSDGQERIRFSVRDTGIGISSENQQRLFQPFSQVEDAARLAGGTGLGLTICRRLAEMMGGSVEMVSEPGQGTTMLLTLLLPIAQPEGRQREDEEGTAPLLASISGSRPVPSTAQAQAEGTLILLVDDHPINRMLLVRQVQTLGYACESAENGMQALEQWRSGRFGLVITDCHMPVMDGYEFAREVRRIEMAEGHRRVPIIACTAAVLSGEAAKCLDAGMDDYLVKPVELSQMLQKLQRWRPIPPEVPKPLASRRSQADADPAGIPLDPALIAANWGSGEEILKDVLAIFGRTTNEDAVNLRQAVASGDMAQVTHFAHRMLGAARMVGALDFAAACEPIDHASRRGDWKTVFTAIEAFESEWQRLAAYIRAC